MDGCNWSALKYAVNALHVTNCNIEYILFNFPSLASFQRDDTTWGRERAAQLQERLEQVAQNNPNVDSPTLVTLKVKEIGKYSTTSY